MPGSLTTRVVVAAGGGGASGFRNPGGNAGQPGNDVDGNPFATPGGAGTQTAGGAGGTGQITGYVPGTDGALGVGGAGGGAYLSPTGSANQAGGGGGSSLVPAGGTLAINTGAAPASVTITYAPIGPITSLALVPAAATVGAGQSQAFQAVGSTVEGATTDVTAQTTSRPTPGRGARPAARARRRNPVITS